jgi:hypothetical protein
MSFKTLWSKRWVRACIYLFSMLCILFIVDAIHEQYLKKQDIENVKIIKSIRLQLRDVDGSNLPPTSVQNINDSTLAGIDINQNYIRDDVELAIFALYPTSTPLRAAALQYAQMLQLKTVYVHYFDAQIASDIKFSRSFSCLTKVISSPKGGPVLDFAENIDRIHINTSSRAEHSKKIDSSYFKKYSVARNDSPCDI